MNNQAKYDEILNSTASKIIIVAGPGTGKTSQVMIPKASQVFSNNEINSNSIVLSSFSRMAALDLKKKVKQLDRAPYACTVHSLCLSFLISENDHDIRDRVDSIVLDFEKDVLISDLKLVFPSKNKNELKKNLTLFSAAWSQEPGEEIFEENEEQKTFKRAVMFWLSEYKAALMEEIAYNAVKLGRTLPGSPFFQEIKYLFVDEFQDLNKLEQEFVKIASANTELLIVLGDPDQSIYSFKFAHPQGIDTFASGLNDVEKHTITYTGRCAKKIIGYANQLLLQNEPTRTNLLQPLPDKEDGEVHFIKRNTQDEEFDYVITRIKELTNSGVEPKDILVLSPKKKLGNIFVKYATDNQDDEGAVKFAFLQKSEFTLLQQERVTLLGVLANPSSLLRIRTYLGLTDDEHFSKELKLLKEKYGNLHDVIQNAKEEDFGIRQKRLRRLCFRISSLREFLGAHTDQDLVSSIEELFPTENEELGDLRALINDILEDDDSISSFYSKFSDQVRTLNTPQEMVSVMTPLASKGLEADHVFIIGCNNGNIPGIRRAEHLTDHEHVQEQRRLLYVAFTRAKKTLTVSWSRYIPFNQALGQNTGRVATRRVNGKAVAQVGICQFLQDLENIDWE
ncbi:MAG: ATP-dependent helicase [Microgenomates group bacterium]